MSSIFQSKVQQELLRKLPKRRGLASGFTLIELMIVVAIVGILAAVALPQYLRARDAANAGALVGEAIGLAKECATATASGIDIIGTAFTARTADGTQGGMAVTCPIVGTGVAGAGTVVGVMPTGRNMPAGVRCIDQASVAAGTDRTVTLTIAIDGGLTCAFT